MTKTDFKNIYEAFMHCDTNKLKKEFAAMYSDNEEQAAAVKEVNRAFARMETVTPKAVNPDEQSIIVVCKGFGDEGDDTVCIEVEDLRKWRKEHLKESEPISDEMLTFMSTDEIENAVMNQDLPTKYAFELSAWDEVLSWKLAPSSIYIYGLEFCLSRVLWEMTFFGVDESGVELEKEKLDTRFEEAQRFFDENKEPQIGFSIEDIAKKLLGDDYTEDWYPEEEQVLCSSFVYISSLGRRFLRRSLLNHRTFSRGGRSCFGRGSGRLLSNASGKHQGCSGCHSSGSGQVFVSHVLSFSFVWIVFAQILQCSICCTTPIVSGSHIPASKQALQIGNHSCSS